MTINRIRRVRGSSEPENHDYTDPAELHSNPARLSARAEEVDGDEDREEDNRDDGNSERERREGWHVEVRLRLDEPIVEQEDGRFELGDESSGDTELDDRGEEGGGCEERRKLFKWWTCEVNGSEDIQRKPTRVVQSRGMSVCVCDDRWRDAEEW